MGVFPLDCAKELEGMPLSRAVGTGGVRGARASPVFWGAGIKIHLEFYKFAWLLSGVHPLILAACYGPVECAAIALPCRCRPCPEVTVQWCAIEFLLLLHKPY